MKKIFLLSFILFLALCFLNPKYNNFFDSSSKFTVIPMIEKNYVPQGMCYFDNWIIISYYSNDDKPSILSVLDSASGKFIKYINIYYSTGKPYTGHAGGVTVSKNYVWVSSDYQIFKLPIKDIINARSGSKIKIIEAIKVPVKGAFIQYDKNILWVGEFYHKYDYLTDFSHELKNKVSLKNNAWIVGLKLDKNESINSLDMILSIPDIVQDIEFYNNYIILSRSYGRKNDSLLQFYDNVLNEKNHTTIKYFNKKIPVWFLDKISLKKEVNILPMSEGISIKDNSLYILFESAALKYRSSGKYPTEYIWSLNLKKLLTHNNLEVKK